MYSATRFRISLVALLLLIAPIGCSKDSTTAEQDPGYEILASGKTRETNPQVSDADIAAAAAGNAEFALKLFPRLDPDGGKNAVFSPYSITQAFAMAAAGAKGATLSGMEQALSFSLPQDRLNPALNKLDLLLASKTTGSINADGAQSPQLNLVNAIWGQRDYAILQEYLDSIAINFGAGLRIVDFVGASEDARNSINRWVAGETNDRIRELIPLGGVSDMTRIVLTNAVWFKAGWASPFRVESTMNQAFYNRDGSTSSIPFMRQSVSLPYSRSNGCQAVDIPYVDEQLSMLVIMPDPGTIDAFLAGLTPAVLSDIIDRLASSYVSFAMPKFTFSMGPDLGEILPALGMTDAFDPAVADFSGMTGNRELHIGNVFHQAFISVDEKGTEAAAATAIGMVVVSLPADIVTMDHPFIFLIRDRETGLILFMGKVVSL